MATEARAKTRAKKREVLKGSASVVVGPGEGAADIETRDVLVVASPHIHKSPDVDAQRLDAENDAPVDSGGVAGGIHGQRAIHVSQFAFVAATKFAPSLSSGEVTTDVTPAGPVDAEL